MQNYNNQYQQQQQQQQFQPQQQQQQMYQQQQQQQQQQLDCLELDHLVGFSGRFPNSVYFHPVQNETIVYSIGGLVIVENVKDKHDQTFLRGHDMPVSAIAVSPSGKFIGSGQLGSLQTKHKEAPVILWDFYKKKAINVFKGLTDGITNMAFSNDDKFLAVTSQNNTFTIWNTQDFSVVYNRLLEIPITLLSWSSVTTSATKHNKYVLITAQGPNIKINSLDFNVGSMQYILSSVTCQLPSSGLIRTYTSALVDPRGEYIYAGTTAGEIAIFNVQNKVFKAAIPICNNGVLSLSLRNDTLYVGSGDGRIKKLRGGETKWMLEKEIQLEGALNAQSLSIDNSELIVGSSTSKLYRILTDQLDALVHTEGHLSPIIDVSFQKDKNDIFSTIDAQGQALVWDNNDLNVITKCINAGLNRAQGLCVTIAADDGTLVAGYEDGFIRCFEISDQKYSEQKWEIANSHKGGVTAIYVDQNYILSGGRDGQVRIWSRVARQLLSQISIHTKDVVSLFPDITKSHIIHSCSIDKSVHSYDLKANKKIIFHTTKNGSILHMTQRRDNEQELVTCGLNTPLLFWDCDVVEPVQAMNVNEKLNCVEISKSGKYMATGTDKGEVVLYEVATTRCIGRFLGHSVGVSKLKWSPDEKQIISVSYDHSLCVWNFFQD